MKRDVLGRAKVGAIWTSVGAIVAVFSQLLIVTAIAVFLSPSSVGEFTVFLFVLGLAVTVFPLGNDFAIVQTSNFSQRNLVFVSAASVSAALISMAVCFLVSPFSPVALHNLEAAIYLGLVAGAVESLFLILSAALQRELNYKSIEKAGITKNLLILPISFGSLLWFEGAHGAMIARVISSAVGVAILLRPAWSASVGSGTGYSVLSSMARDMIWKNSLGHISRNAEIVAAGPQMGVSGLGVYDLGRRLVAQPRDFIGTVIFKFTYPIFAKIAQISNGAVRNRFLRRAYRGAVRSAAVVGFPVFALALLVADPVVPLVFGPQFAGGIQVLQIFAATAFIQVLGNNLITSALTALGASRVVLLAEIYTVVPRLIAVYAASFFGPAAVAGATSLFIVLKLVWMQWELSKRSTLSFDMVLRCTRTIWVSVSIGLAVSWPIRFLGDSLLLAMTGAFIFMIVYTGLVVTIDRAIREELIRTLRNLKRKKFK